MELTALGASLMLKAVAERWVALLLSCSPTYVQKHVKISEPSVQERKGWDRRQENLFTTKVPHSIGSSRTS